MEIHFAPIQGYVDNTYRRLHAAIYGGIDFYYTPFMRIEKGEPRRQDLLRMMNAVNDGTPVIPQVIFSSLEEFTILVNAIKDLGYKCIDLNLGCPYPMQTKRGRGAAMMSNAAVMQQVTEYMAKDINTTYSVKIRLGKESIYEWQEILPLLNNVRLRHITVHPRTARQMYSGELHLTQLQQIINLSTNPIIYNGEIRTISDITALHNVNGVMIGRGLLARPSLAAEWRCKEEWAHEKRIQKLLEFHSLLYDEYKSTLCGATQILQKIKPFWDYLEPEIGRKAFKSIHKATTLEKYIEAVASI